MTLITVALYSKNIFILKHLTYYCKQAFDWIVAGCVEHFDALWIKDVCSCLLTTQVWITLHASFLWFYVGVGQHELHGR